MPTPSLGYGLKSRSAPLCLRRSRTPKRTIRSNVQEADFELDALPKSRSYNFYTYIPI